MNPHVLPEQADLIKEPVSISLGRKLPVEGDTIKYVGDAMGKLPKNMEFVKAKLLSVCGEAAFINTSDNPVTPHIWGVSLNDCLLESQPTSWPTLT